MPPLSRHSDQLTDHETQLGFEIIEIQNPDTWVGCPPRINAVVRPVNTTDRIVKWRDSAAGSPEYQIQRYGLMNLGPMGTEAESMLGWKPISDPFPMPEQAIECANLGHHQQLADRVVPRDPGENY